MFRGIIEEIGRGTLRTVSPILEFFAPIVPQYSFPLYFEIGLFQSALSLQFYPLLLLDSWVLFF